MSGNKVRNFYWDACIFIAWLKNEQRSNLMDMAGINEQVDLFKKGNVQLATSVITLIEVLASGVSPGNRDRLEQLFRRRNYHLIEVNRKIADIAHEIRDYYQQQGGADGLPTIATPDAIHLATAIWYKCDILCTFDANDKRGRQRGLIPLNQNVAGKYDLVIAKPKPTQLPLGL
ncbi:MAG: type II toxin-antitoxin system VapC family toxin [Ardenticatenaceae bacterium]|nr:type II toxin-antitoxin system VapC family toxin [Ardenticatenaceae bacterium]